MKAQVSSVHLKLVLTMSYSSYTLCLSSPEKPYSVLFQVFLFIFKEMDLRLVKSHGHATCRLY